MNLRDLAEGQSCVRCGPCSVDGCDGYGNRRGLCNKHYLRMKKNGSPLIVSRRGSTAPIERFHLAITKTDFCWLWNGPFNKAGYGKTRLRQKHIAAHRLAWILFRGEIPDGAWVLHKCDNPRCVNPDHLFLGDVQANVDDMISKGRKVIPVGEAHGNAKLTAALVEEIRSSTETNAHIARRLKLAPSCISKVRNRKAWRSVA